MQHMGFLIIKKLSLFVSFYRHNHLCLNDGESGQRTTSVHFVHLSGTLEQTGVQVEDVTGVGLTTRGATQQQRHLTISDGLFRQIVVDDQSVLAIVTEILAYMIQR